MHPLPLLRSAVLAMLVCGAGCDTTGTAPTQPDPLDRPNPPTALARTYKMGWAPTPPRPETQLVLAVIDSIDAISEVTILQQEPPWERLLAGVPMADLVEELGGLVDHLRTKGLEIVFLVDPLDGLNRQLEPPSLVAANRSLKEPQIRAMHEAWVRALTSRIQPRWLGLASEINSLAEGGDLDLYAEIVDMVNTLAPQVRTLSPSTDVFVSFQVDQANGSTPGGVTIDHFALIDDFDIDALGMSSYPFFFFDAPGDVPDNHFATFDAVTDLPLLFVEGGWGSASVPGKSSTPLDQVAWFDRYETLLDGVEADLWVTLIFTDLDIPNLGLPADRAAMLGNFASMGVMDIDFNRKPAYETWQRIFDRPRVP